MEYKFYKFNKTVELRPYIEGENLEGISISSHCVPEKGGIINSKSFTINDLGLISVSVSFEPNLNSLKIVSNLVESYGENYMRNVKRGGLGTTMTLDWSGNGETNVKLILINTSFGIISVLTYSSEKLTKL